MEKEYSYSLTEVEASTLINVLEKVQSSGYQARQTINKLMEKLAEPMGGLVFTPAKEEAKPKEKK